MSNAFSVIKNRIESEVDDRRRLYAILDICCEKKSAQKAEEEINTLPEMVSSTQSALVLLKWLVECAAVEQTQHDDALYVQTTELGQKVLLEEKSQNKIDILFQKEPENRDVYEVVLHACTKGNTRIEIEKILSGHPILEASKLLTSYFLDNLEKAGALYWDGTQWVTSNDVLEKLSV